VLNVCYRWSGRYLLGLCNTHFVDGVQVHRVLTVWYKHSKC
jgi:uncharacterized membrane protein